MSARSARPPSTTDAPAATPATGRDLVVHNLAVAVFYLALALGARSLDLPPGYVIPFWPAAGLAVAAVLVGGTRCLPGVWLGAWLYDVTIDPTAGAAALGAWFAAAATLQAWVGARLTRRYFDTPVPLAGSVARFLLGAGPLACVVSSTLGVAAMVAAGKAASDDFVPQWIAWWTGDTVGVLLFAPLALLAWPRLVVLRVQGVTRTTAALLTTAVLVVAAQLALARLERTQVEESLQQRMQSAFELGALPLQRPAEALEAVERLFAASSDVGRREFQVFADHVLKWAEVRSVEWLPRVPAFERPRYEAELRRMHGVDFIAEPGEGGGRVRAADRDVYFPAHYVEPYAGNEATLGLDYGAFPERRAAMARAREAGGVTATPQVRLLRNGAPGYFAFLPVYVPGVGPRDVPVQQREATLRGYVAVALDHGTLFRRIAIAASDHALAYRVTDTTLGQPREVLAGSLPAAAAAPWSREIDLGGRLLRVEFAASGPEWRAGTSATAQALSIASVLAAFLVAVAVLGNATRYAHTAAQVVLRTAELRASEQDLETTLLSIGDGVLTTDEAGRVLRMNPVAERLTGWSNADARGVPATVVFRTDERPGGADATHREPVLVARDGSARPIAVTSAPLSNAGSVRGVVLVFRDVADERAAARALADSRERYRRLIEELPYALVVQCDGTFVFANAVACRMFAAPDGELVGRAVLDFVDPVDRDAVAERMRRLRDERTAAPPREFRWRRLDGTPFWAESSAVPYEHDGRRGSLVIMQDITARKSAETQRDRFFDLSPDLFCLSGFDGRFRRVNPAFTRTLGWTGEELAGTPVLALLHDEDRATTLAQVRKLAAGEQRTAFEGRFRCRDGSWRWLAWQAMADPDGDVYATARDTTAQHAAQLELRAAREAAEAASRAKSAFLAAMSHEIRTPMNGVVGMVELLGHTRLAPAQAEMVHTIAESAGALLGLIDDILDFSKIEAGRMDIERASVALGTLVEDLCQSLVTVADAQDVELSVHVSPRVPARVWSDAVRVRQLLYNIVGNAIKFSGRRAGRRGHVSVRVDADDGSPARLALRVADDGVGMSAATIAGLFQPFVQAESSTTRRFGGSGLGLAICRRLVDLMGGAIAVDSTPGGGSTFTVTLPLEAAPPETEPAPPPLAGVPCIVVDGRAPLAADVVDYLAAAGADARVASGVGPAAALAADLPGPVVIVLRTSDIASPGDLAGLLAAPGVRPVVIGRGARQAWPAAAAEATLLEDSLLRRAPLVAAAAVAAGRASPRTVREHGETLPVAAMPPQGVEVARASGRLILVAEDDAVNREVILRQLALLGYDAEVACDGGQALAMLGEGRHALLLTDLHMPRVDGYTLVRALRARESPGTRLPIVALTANAVRGEAERAREVGVDDYLVKPAPLARLQATLARWLPDTGAAPARTGGDASPGATFDIGTLRALVGGDEGMACELLRDFVATASSRWSDEIADVEQGGDPQRLGGLAHRIKSAARSVGALALGDACADLEEACRSGDEPALARRLAVFRAAFADARQAIADWLDRVPA